MQIAPCDITFTYNTKGYMLYYKGHCIGGAGIDKHAKGCRSNLKLFRECAEQDKRKIVTGHGSRYYLYEIEKYQKQEAAV